MTTAVLLAGAPARDGGAAAELAWEDTTLAGRLSEQLRSLGVEEIHVLTRAQSPDVAADIAFVADVARRAPGAVAVIAGDVVTQREALAGLLADPRVGTGVLSTRARSGAGRARAALGPRAGGGRRLGVPRACASRRSASSAR